MPMIGAEYGNAACNLFFWPEFTGYTASLLFVLRALPFFGQPLYLFLAKSLQSVPFCFGYFRRNDWPVNVLGSLESSPTIIPTLVGL